MSGQLLHLRSDGGPCQHCGWTIATTMALITEECPGRLRPALDDLAHRHAALLIDVGTLLALAADLGDGEAHRVARVGNARIVALEAENKDLVAERAALRRRAEEEERRIEALERAGCGRALAAQEELRMALTTARECWDGMRGLIAAHGYAEEDVAAMDAALSEPASVDPTAQAHGNTALTDPLGQHDAAVRAAARREEREAMPGALDVLREQIVAWQRETFPHATPASCVAHLRKEVEELSANPADPMEIADCLFLLFGVADRAGVCVGMALHEKLRINRARTWGAVNAEGFVEHEHNEKETP